MEKKKSNVGIVILVIILMCGCLVGGYFLSAKNIINIGKNNDVKESNKANKKSTEECSKEEALDISSKEVLNLFNETINAHATYCGFYELYKDKKVEPKNLNETDIAKMVVLKVLESKGETKEGQTYTKKEFEDAAQSLFGKDFEYKHVSIMSCPSFDYDASKEMYTEGGHACGGTCGPTNISRLVKAIRTTNGMEIYVRMVFRGYMVNGDVNDNNYYANYNLTKKLNFSVNDMDRLTYEYNEITSQGALYKLSFGKEDNNYYLISVEPVNE